LDDKERNNQANLKVAILIWGIILLHKIVPSDIIFQYNKHKQQDIGESHLRLIQSLDILSARLHKILCNCNNELKKHADVS
jgi:hypothetical protein